MTHDSPRLLQIIGISLVCVALFSLAGGHWALLQTIAWAQMVRDYSSESPLTEAIAKTFSGQFPCGMCTKISEERQKEERTPASAKFDKKAEALVVKMCEALKRPEAKDFSYLNSGGHALIERCEAPAAPIPIFA
jgi:hypothetical protein